MSKRFLGKVAAGSAAVAGAFLLVAAPGVAQAAAPPDGRHDTGCIVTYPKVVKPGHEVKIIAKCKKPQDKPWAWSEVTGKVWLKPWYPPKPEPRPTREPMAVPDGEMSDGMSGDHYSSGSQADESWAGDADGRMSDGYGRGHKDGIDPRQPADADSQWFSGDKREDGKKDGDMADGRGHKDGIDPRGDDSQVLVDPMRDGRGHKDGIDPRRPADADSQWFSGDKREDGKKDGDMADGRGHKDGIDPRGDDSQVLVDGSSDGMVDGKVERKVEHKTFVYWGEAKVYRHAKPGKYWIKGSCGVGRLIVAPKGWVDGGDGGSTGTNTGLAAGGATALAAAAVGGVALVRRRKADGSLA